MPLGLIYLLSDLFYFVIRFVLPYRKKVILSNLQNAFPNQDEREIKRIQKRFYRFFANLFAESIKNLTISEKNLRKRMKVVNPELFDELKAENKDVILLSSHYNNWEFLITAQSLLIDFQAVGIGMPLSNKFWDKKLNARRERFGMKVVHAKNYKNVLRKYKNTPTTTLILNDQSPGKDENCYWTDFLNQQTAFYFGAEVMANQMDAAVVNGVIRRVKRGQYEIEFYLITNCPKNESYGYITETYVRQLEREIKLKPEFWLWSHKRWKKEVPNNLQEIKAQHKKRFIERFRS